MTSTVKDFIKMLSELKDQNQVISLNFWTIEDIEGIYEGIKLSDDGLRTIFHRFEDSSDDMQTLTDCVQNYIEEHQ